MRSRYPSTTFPLSPLGKTLLLLIGDDCPCHRLHHAPSLHVCHCTPLVGGTDPLVGPRTPRLAVDEHIWPAGPDVPVRFECLPRAPPTASWRASVSLVPSICSSKSASCRITTLTRVQGATIRHVKLLRPSYPAVSGAFHRFFRRFLGWLHGLFVSEPIW
jgi:hypothetical protein